MMRVDMGSPIASIQTRRSLSPRLRRRLLVSLVIAAVVVLSALDHAGVFGYRPEGRHKYEGAFATITYAADGDTLDVDIPEAGRPVTRIRLWGVDCPEIAHQAGEKDAYWGREATDFVRQTCVGQRVRLELDPSQVPRDRFGRLLAYVHLVDSGEMLNEVLVQRGFAYADRRFRHVYKDRFIRLEKEAVHRKAGLWAGVREEQMPAWRQRMDAAAVP